MLLDDIIAILSDGKGSLTDALLKTKVFLVATFDTQFWKRVQSCSRQ